MAILAGCANALAYLANLFSLAVNSYDLVAPIVLYRNITMDISLTQIFLYHHPHVIFKNPVLANKSV
jgi:hypothetical protein